MPSGNFLIGQYIPMEDFIELVEPALKENGCSVPEKLSVRKYGKDNTDAYDTILTSIAGDGDLTKMVNDSLVKSGKIFAKLNKNYSSEAQKWLHFMYPISSEIVNGEVTYYTDDPKYVGQFEIIGIYEDKEEASRHFPEIAEGFLLMDKKAKTAELTDNLTEYLQKARDILPISD